LCKLELDYFTSRLFLEFSDGTIYQRQNVITGLWWFTFILLQIFDQTSHILDTGNQKKKNFIEGNTLDTYID